MPKKKRTGPKLTPKQEIQKKAIERECLARGGDGKSCTSQAFAITLGQAKKKRKKSKK